MAKKKIGIVGKWLLGFNQDGKLDLQGRVLERMKEGIYLIETYGWSDGEVYDEHIISVEQMCNWRFYPDFETFGLRTRQRLKSEDAVSCKGSTERLPHKDIIIVTYPVHMLHGLGATTIGKTRRTFSCV